MGNRTNELVVYAAGPKSAINDFIISEPRAVVDLSKMAAGEQTVLITEANIKHPKEVTILDINPGELEVSLAGLSQTTIAITPQLIGQLPQPLKLKKVEITPKELEVFAPSARQDNKAPSIFTTPVYLSSITGNTTLIRKIVAPPSIQPMDKRWPDVEVVITVE